MRALAGKAIKAIVRPFGITTCLLVVLALVVWFVGPLIGSGDFQPLRPVAVRLAILLVMALGWGIAGIILHARRRAEDQKLIEAARRDNDEKKAASKQDDAAARARFASFAESARGAFRATGASGRFSSGLAGPRRTLPRYLVLGPQGSGKTALLANSGLTVHNDSLREPGDQPARFMVSDEGLFIEIAGSCLRQADEHEKAVWPRMLDFIRRRRPGQPVNGILLTIGVDAIIAMSSEEAAAFAGLLRRRSDEIARRFRARPPIYIVLTKLDLLVGFDEFFDSLTMEEREAIFGFPLWSPDDTTSPAKRLDAGFAEIMKRLKERQLRRLQEETDEDLRLRAFEFPGQFALLQSRLAAFVDVLSAQTHFATPPVLRGIFFTSALQTGRSKDVVPGILASTFAMKPEAVSARPKRPSPHVRPLFLRGLVHEAILGEPTLGGYSRSAAAAGQVRSVAVNAIIALAIFGFALFWWLSFSEGRAYTARLFDEVKSAATQLTAVAHENDGKLAFQPVLVALDRLRTIADEAPKRTTFALYSSAPAREAGARLYDRGLKDLLRPFIAQYAKVSLDSPLLDVTERFQLLKFYLMLGGTRPLDAATARLVAPGFARTMLGGPPADDTDPAEHLIALASVKAPDLPIDQTLVDSARSRIANAGLAKLAYDMLLAQPDIRSLPVWRPVDYMGADGPQALARVSDASLWNGIPGLYTREGYQSFLLSKSKQTAADIAKDLWVMGKDSSPIEVRQQEDRIREGVFDLYTVDTIRQWDSLLADLTIVPVSDAGEAAKAIATLIKTPSPITQLLTAIARETDFGGGSLAAQGSAIAEPRLARGQRLLAAVPHRVVNVAKSVTDHYARLASALGVDEPPPQKDAKVVKETQVGAVLAALQPLYAQLNLVATGGDVLSLGTKPQDTLNDLDRMIKELPDLLQPFFRRVVVQMAAVAGISSRERLADIWDTTVAPKCQAAVAGHYPFDPKSHADTSLADFAAVFGPKGAIAMFRASYLKPFIDTTTTPWQWRGGQKIGLGLGEDVLASFEQADRITHTYFTEGGAPGVKFEMKPLGLDSAASAFQFDYGGPVYVYAHGPAMPATVSWPPQTPGADASLSVTPEIAGRPNVILEHGPWALFRLLHDGRRINADKTAAGVTDLRFSVGGRPVTLEFTAPATSDPIGSDLLAGYVCPRLSSQHSAER